MSVKTFSTTGTPGFFAATGYISIDDIKTVVCNTSNIPLEANLPIAYAAFTGSGIPAGSNIIGIRGGIMTFPNGSQRNNILSSDSYASPGNYVAIPYSQSRTVPLSYIFNSNNSTTKTVDVNLVLQTSDYVYTSYTNGSCIANPSADTVLSVIRYVLDAPPTFKVIDSGGTETTSVEFDTAYVYSGLTTASVSVSNLSAKYGGSVSSVALTIGSQTVTRSNAGELSILLNAGGTFTPTVTVTDSRGQTTTKTLDPITVNTYTAPSVSFDVARTLNDGTPDDEGTYGLIEAELTFTDVVATAVAPSVVLTDDDGTQTTPSVTWYTDSSLTTQVTWANVSSGDTVYGLFSGLSTQHSYQVSVRPRDSEGTGTAVTQTIAPAFYTVDFYAGGHGIAFGKPASDTGFECAMTATFENTATFGSDIYIDLSDYQTTGSVDKELYDAIVALGWDSDVLVN